MHIRRHWRAAAMVVLACPAVSVAGSLYRADQYAPLTSDIRSFKVGDAVTVQIVESSNAQAQAQFTQSRDMNLSATAQGSVAQHTAGVELQRKNDNSGVTGRSGTLQAEISVRIQEVAANGDLVVRGTQTITVNGESQKIVVAGVVRPIDVSADNVVLSTRLTNAQIEYTGRGFVDASQRESWISRFFGMLGL